MIKLLKLFKYDKYSVWKKEKKYLQIEPDYVRFEMSTKHIEYKVQWSLIFDYIFI